MRATFTLRRRRVTVGAPRPNPRIISPLQPAGRDCGSRLVRRLVLAEREGQTVCGIHPATRDPRHAVDADMVEACRGRWSPSTSGQSRTDTDTYGQRSVCMRWSCVTGTWAWLQATGMLAVKFVYVFGAIKSSTRLPDPC